MISLPNQSPAWFAARESHNILCLNPESWADRPELYAWLHELVAIIEQPGLVERYRQELLTPEELAVVRQQEAELEEHGF